MIPNKQEFDPYAVMRALADGTLRDPVGDCSQAIVEELQREIVHRQTSWHDCELSTLVEEIIREHFPELPQASLGNTSTKA